MSYTVTLKINIDVLLLYEQDRYRWPIPAKHLRLISAKDIPRCKVGNTLFHARTDLH